MFFSQSIFNIKSHAAQHSPTLLLRASLVSRKRCTVAVEGSRLSRCASFIHIRATMYYLKETTVPATFCPEAILAPASDSTPDLTPARQTTTVTVPWDTNPYPNNGPDTQTEDVQDPRGPLHSNTLFHAGYDNSVQCNAQTPPPSPPSTGRVTARRAVQ